MTSLEEWVEMAAARAECAAAALRRMHTKRRFFPDLLTEAENDLHAACEHCKDAAKMLARETTR
jgi:hypothetical protein